MRNLMRLSSPALWLTISLALSSSIAHADPIQFSTSGSVNFGYPADGASLIRFLGTTGTFDVDSGFTPFSLGQFWISAPPKGETVSYHDLPFAIEVRVPSLNQTILPSSPNGNRTEVENSIIIRGRINGINTQTEINSVYAIIDSVHLGSINPRTLDHITEFEFPIPPSALGVAPDGMMLLLPTDSWGNRPGGGFSTLDARLEIPNFNIPEPSTAAVFLVGLASVGFWRHRRRD